MEKIQQSCPIFYSSPLFKMDHNISNKIFTYLILEIKTEFSSEANSIPDPLTQNRITRGMYED